MKTLLTILPLAASMLLLIACSNPQEQKPEAAESPITEVPADVPKFESISGVVAEIQPGKDGYTAKVRTTKHEDVFVTVSRVNLKEPESYRSVKIGDTLQVIGEEWEMNGRTYLTARLLQ